MWFMDPLYIIIIGPALLLALWAQAKVKFAFSRYSRIANLAGITGAQAARLILDGNGLQDVPVEAYNGWLTDHYDPRRRVLRLSQQVFYQPSVAAVGIAAHEAGHALQHSSGYFPLRFRNAIVPTAQIGSWLAFPMILIGMLLALKTLALAGFILFLGIVLFQVVTLPVELNASSRAKKVLAEMQILKSPEETRAVNSVLSAAAMTYVAATITALAQLVYFAFRLGLIGGRRRN